MGQGQGTQRASPISQFGSLVRSGLGGWLSGEGASREQDRPRGASLGSGHNSALVPCGLRSPVGSVSARSAHGRRALRSCLTCSGWAVQQLRGCVNLGQPRLSSANPDCGVTLVLCSSPLNTQGHHGRCRRSSLRPGLGERAACKPLFVLRPPDVGRRGARASCCLLLWPPSPNLCHTVAALPLHELMSQSAALCGHHLLMATHGFPHHPRRKAVLFSGRSPLALPLSCPSAWALEPPASLVGCGSSGLTVPRCGQCSVEHTLNAQAC